MLRAGVKRRKNEPFILASSAYKYGECLENSPASYSCSNQLTPLNNPEDGRIQFSHGGSLRPRNVQTVLVLQLCAAGSVFDTLGASLVQHLGYTGVTWRIEVLCEKPCLTKSVNWGLTFV